jgi:hypothetical protein
MAAPPTRDEPEKTVTPLAAILAQVDRGRPHADASDAFAAVFEAVHNEGGKGDVTVKFTVAPVSKGNTDQLAVTVTVTSKAPKRAPKPSVWFYGADGAPSKEDPQQPAIEGLKIAQPVERKISGGDQ